MTSAERKQWEQDLFHTWQRRALHAENDFLKVSFELAETQKRLEETEKQLQEITRKFQDFRNQF